MRHIALAVLLAIGPQASADNGDKATEWVVRMMRIEGAAAEVRRAAEKVEITSKKISDYEYLKSFTQLKTELDELNRLVISAQLAVDVAKAESNPPE